MHSKASIQGVNRLRRLAAPAKIPKASAMVVIYGDRHFIQWMNIIYMMITEIIMSDCVSRSARLAAVNL